VLHDFGHACKEAEIMKSLNLPKFPGRQYNPNGTTNAFTTLVKVKEFSHEEDSFDDIFLQKETFIEVKHMVSLPFDPEEIEAFNEYRDRRLLEVPLDQLQFEPIREPTPNISLEESSRETSKDDSEEESQEKSIRESEHSVQ